MSVISRITTWVSDAFLDAPSLNGEFNNIVSVLNSLDAGSTQWDNTNTNQLTCAGAIMTGPIAMGGNKITGLANGVATTDLAAFGQIPALTIKQTIFSSGGLYTLVNSASYISTVITGTITPSSSSSRILVMVSAMVSSFNTTSDSGVNLAIYRNGSSITSSTVCSLANGSASTIQFTFPINLTYVDSPSSTLSTTYTIYAKNETSHGGYIGGGLGNGGSGIWSMVLQEIV